MFSQYILKGHTPVICTDIHTWSKARAKNRILFKTTKEGLHISTVFLGMDIRMDNDVTPLLFETMVFNDEEYGNAEEGNTKRYETWEEAKEGHFQTCKKVLTSYTEDDMFLDML
jgi:hypothetical protein|tara:strand:- start:85 stop:426 length:342 start_codon:yes stop_codon:yes gene_type:complete